MNSNECLHISKNKDCSCVNGCYKYCFMEVPDNDMKKNPKHCNNCFVDLEGGLCNECKKGVFLPNNRTLCGGCNKTYLLDKCPHCKHKKCWRPCGNCIAYEECQPCAGCHGFMSIDWNDCKICQQYNTIPNKNSSKHPDCIVWDNCEKCQEYDKKNKYPSIHPYCQEAISKVGTVVQG